MVGCEKGDMESGVDFPHFGEAELVCDWRQDFDDCERFLSFWCELWVCDRSFEVSGF